MAWNKEAIVFVLDVGIDNEEEKQDDDTSFLKKSLKCMTKILQRMIFSESKDEVGLVLCGASDTNNQLATEIEYRNIVLSRELGPVNWPFMETVDKIGSSSSIRGEGGDLIDALVVAMDHLVTRTRLAKFAAREIYLLSDLRREFSSDQLETIVKGLKKENIVLNIVGPDLKKAESGSSRRRPGVSILRKIINEVDGTSYSFEEIVPELSHFKRKTIRAVPWKVTLEVAPSLEIPVCAYLKVKKSTTKSWKKAYAKDPSLKIVSEQSYHKNDDLQEAIEKSETIKAYRYGRTLVPFSDEDKSNMEYRSGGKSFRILGFTKQSNIKRHHFLGDCSHFVIADKTSATAVVGLSALIRALHETELVGIVRHVYSEKSDPKLGILAPRIKANYECLVFIQVPFAEDLRPYTFPALDSDVKNIPTDQQLDAMDELIDSMDLTNTKTKELRQRSILNPQVQRLYQCLLHRALKPKDPLPDVDQELLKMFTPNPNILAAGEIVGNKLKNLFPLEKVISKKDKKTAASFFQKTPEDDEPPSKYRKLNADDEEDAGGVAAFVRMEVTEVKTIDPTSDFVEIIRANPNEFSNAFKQMTKVILQLVMDSFGDLLTEENHKKAFSCLKVLRHESIAKSSLAFNSFLREFRDSLLAKEKRSFWNEMREHKISLITREEDPIADSSSADAEKFFVEDEMKEEKSQVSDEGEDEEDLLNMM